MSVEWGRGGLYTVVTQLAENKSRAVSELAREVGLSEEKVTSVIEKLGLTEITRFRATADTKAQATADTRVLPTMRLQRYFVLGQILLYSSGQSLIRDLRAALVLHDASDSGRDTKPAPGVGI